MRLPLAGGELTDISVTSDETLGFAVIEGSGGIAGRGGAWPLGADPYKPKSWGDLRVELE